MLQFHPITWGVMLVVAIGTVAYTVWSTGQQHANYGHSNQNRHFGYNDSTRNSSNTSTQADSDDENDKKKKRRQKDDPCVICLGILKGTLSALPCTHIFHSNCIEKWLVNNNTCPVCRKIQKQRI